MNKIITVTIVCLGLAFSAFSQYRHKYGELAPSEIDMKQCSFDPEASAVMLVSEAFCDHDEDYHLVTLHHKRIKILSEKGIENGDVTISFQSKNDYEYIDNIEAMTINIDENGNRKEFPVESKSVYSKQTSQYFSQIKFAFPEVRAGSILEYRYRSVKKYCSSLEDWYFQSSLPVCYSSFEVRPAPTLEFSYQVQKNVKYPIVIKPSSFTNTTYFEMDNLPGLDAEPFMDTREDYIQKINFMVTKFQGVAGTQKYMNDWDEVARDLSGETGFGPETRTNVREPREMIATATAGKSDIEKMIFIHDFVRKNTEWNHVYSRSAVDGVRTAWNKKTGTSGSINLLLVNLLKNAGLEVYPLLVSDRSNGKINTGTPFVNQFNNVYAIVVVNGKSYYLDATDKFTPSQLIPTDILNTTALIVKSRSGELIEIKEQEKKYEEIIYGTANVSDHGEMTAHVQTVSKEYAQQFRKRNYNGTDKQKYVENVLKQGLSNISIDSLEVTGDKDDSSDFVQRFTLKENVQSTGEYSFIGLNMFTGFEKNPFILNDRFSSVNFGYMKSVNLIWLIDVPASWNVDALPKSVKMINQDRSAVFYREIIYDKKLSQVSARIKIELNKSKFDVDEYAGLKEFFGKMTDMLNEQIVFKTK